MEAFFCESCIAAMPSAKFWIAFAVVTGISLAALLGARASFIKARLIEDMPTSRIRSASQGFVELIGLAKLRGEPLRAPLTGAPCLWWRYRIERYQKSGKSSSWRTVDKGVSTVSFFMDDGSGQCRIDPTGGDISCLHRKVWYGSSRLPASAVLTVQPTLLNRLGGILTNGRYRYTEYLIKDGDPLYLLGHFESDSSGRRTLTIDQVAGQLIRKWKKDYCQFLVRFDADGNGELDPPEWQTVQDTAADLARQKQVGGGDADNLLRRPEDRGLPFIIGSHGQGELTRKYRFRAAASAAGFLAAGALSVWLLQSRF